MSPLIPLTLAERLKFTCWLLEQSTANEQLIEQMEKIHTPKFVINNFKMEAAAYRMVAAKINPTEEETLITNDVQQGLAPKPTQE